MDFHNDVDGKMAKMPIGSFVFWKGVSLWKVPLFQEEMKKEDVQSVVAH